MKAPIDPERNVKIAFCASFRRQLADELFGFR